MPHPFSASTRRRFQHALALQERELRSDRVFFGAIGAILGFAANAIVRAQEIGMKVSLSAINDLLSDFMSVKATLLIFTLLALASSVRNLIILKFGSAERLVRIAAHSAQRLRQFSSSITCFSAGFSAALTATVLGSFDAQALVLGVMVFVVGASASCFAVLGTALHRNIGFTKEAWISALVSLGCLTYLALIVSQGFN